MLVRFDLASKHFFAQVTNLTAYCVICSKSLMMVDTTTNSLLGKIMNTTLTHFTLSKEEGEGEGQPTP